MTFRLYSDAVCATQIFVSSNRTLTSLNSATSGTATSEIVRADQRGPEYFWRAFYSGDTNNLLGQRCVWRRR